MKGRINILTIIGAVICVGSLILLLTRANLVLVDSMGRTPANLLLTLLLGGGAFAILKGLFPDRSATWYINHIKILVSIFFIILILVTVLTI